MGQRTLHSGEDADHDNPTPVAPKSARQVRPRGWVGSLPGDRSYPSVRDGAGAHDACLEALHAGLGAHRLWRADEQRSGGAGWEDSIAGGWLRLTRLMVVVPVVGDLYGHVPGATVHVTVEVANYGNYDHQACQPEPATGYRIFPPGSTGSLLVSAPQTVCSKPGGQGFQTSVVRTGTIPD